MPIAFVQDLSTNFIFQLKTNLHCKRLNAFYILNISKVESIFHTERKHFLIVIFIIILEDKNVFQIQALFQVEFGKYIFTKWWFWQFFFDYLHTTHIFIQLDVLNTNLENKRYNFLRSPFFWREPQLWKKLATNH